MGVDLRLIPVEASVNGVACYGHTLLSLDRDNELFERLYSIGQSGDLVSPEFKTFVGRDDTYGATPETKYGERLRSLRARLLARYLRESQWSTPRNLAVAAYLEAISDVEVALYWH